MSTGENEQALRKILDFTRLSALIILFLHFYFYCYQAFKLWGWTAKLSDNLLKNLIHSGLFINFNSSKLIALGLLIVSLMGAKGKKEEKINFKSLTAYFMIGTSLYFGSYWLLKVEASIESVAIIYMAVTGTGFLLILSGGILLSRLIKLRLSKDIFNNLNETF